VPCLDLSGEHVVTRRRVNRIDCELRPNRPRVEGMFARIEALDQRSRRHYPLAQHHTRERNYPADNRLDRVRLMDLGGGGRLAVATFDSRLPGFYERDAQGSCLAC